MMTGFGAMWGGGLLWIIVLGLLVWAVVAVTARASPARSAGSGRTILDERFARGELAPEEYRKLREALK